MKESKKINQINIKITKEKTFTVPFSLEEIKNNVSISTNIASQLSKEEIINQAFMLHSQGNVLEAKKYYQYFFDQGFTDPRMFSNYGIILKDHGNLEKAELLVHKAIELKPNYARAYFNLGIISRALEKIKKAEISYRKAITLKPDLAEAHSNLGNILRALGKPKEAEISLRKAIKLRPDFAEAHSNLGNIMRALGKLQEAELSYRKAIELDPSFANTHYNLGNILNDLGKLQEAERSTRKAIELNPNLSEAYSNLSNILRDLGKLQEVILLSKSTLESKTINQGYKVRAVLDVTIATLLQGDFPKTLLNLNITKELINQGAINDIENQKNRKHTSTFYRFISSLYPLLEKESKNSNIDKIPHIGESHCLSFAHQTLSIFSKPLKIQPVLITGGKAWHFANQEHNQWKDSLTQQIKNHTYSDKVFISFGEIDCRKDEGIISYSIKKNKDILEVCENTINGYLNHMEDKLSLYYSKRYYFGIPAPMRTKGIPDQLDMKRIEMIKIYNSYLKKEVLSRGSYFIDVYSLTSTIDGVNNNIHFCDQTHLSPRCLSILFKNCLYEPEIE